MHSWKSKLSLALLTLAAVAALSPARALVVAPPPGPQRAAQAEAITVGRVIGIEPMDIQLPPTPGLPSGTFRVAVVAVTESIKGLKDAKQIRLAFTPPPQNNPMNPVLIRPGGIRGVQPTVGMEALFFLTKHPKENVYLAPAYYDVVAANPQNNVAFERELEQAKKAVKVLENPLATLKGTDADERVLAAAMLIAKYRNPRNFSPKTEPIDAEESKLILKAIQEGKWNQPRVFGQQGPYEVFMQLGLTPKDGWQPKGVKTQQDLHKQAQDWLKANAESYRIQRFVPTASATLPGTKLKKVK